jgi:AcrR family transcriptional regulator
VLLGKTMTTAQIRLLGSAPSDTRKRRQSLSRELSEQRLIEATVVLLKTHTASEISVRQIAHEADVNHGLVHSYFGSKSGLLVAVADQLISDLITTLNQDNRKSFDFDCIDSEKEAIIGVLLWLMVTGEEISVFQILGALVVSVSSHLANRDRISPTNADSAAVLMVSVSIGGMLYRLMHTTESQQSVKDATALWKHMMHLLADNPL